MADETTSVPRGSRFGGICRILYIRKSSGIGVGLGVRTAYGVGVAACLVTVTVTGCDCDSDVCTRLCLRMTRRLGTQVPRYTEVEGTPSARFDLQLDSQVCPGVVVVPRTQEPPHLPAGIRTSLPDMSLRKRYRQTSRGSSGRPMYPCIL